MKNKEHIVFKVIPSSIAEELGIEPGDKLLQINGHEILDVFDYHYGLNDEEVVLLIEKPDGQQWEFEIEKELNEDLGIEFEDGLMDSYRSCTNKCVFCFIDQMPPNMRETLYFKDDDARLSFLQGNYITLTNLSDEDIDRIIYYKLSPINVSIHTTNKELRKQMLNNRFAGDALDKLERFYDNNITMNSQIVLCKGLNDGKELEKTIKDLTKYMPVMNSLSIVPVGLTKYRDGLSNLEKFSPEDSKEVVDIVSKWQKYSLERYGKRFVFASDEWYLTAGLEVPPEEDYEGYLQIENGVGMIRSFVEEFKAESSNVSYDESYTNKESTISLATGVLATPVIKEFIKEINKTFPSIKVNVYTIMNEFFGTNITVAGLITGQDIIEQLKDKELGQTLLLPSALLRHGENVLLDDLTVDDIEEALNIKITIVNDDGKSFLKSIIDQAINKSEATNKGE